MVGEPMTTGMPNPANRGPQGVAERGTQRTAKRWAKSWAKHRTEKRAKRLTIAAMVSAFALLGCGGSAPEGDRAPAIRPAKLVTVDSASDIRTLRLPTIVAATDTTAVTFQVSGQLQDITLVEGAAVARGDVLARLDQRSFNNDLISAQAQFDNAQAEFERAASLLDRDAISKSAFDQRRSQRDVARAQLDSAQKRLDDSVVRAPYDAVVAEIYVESFESISVQQPIMTIQSRGDAAAVVQMPASIVVNAEQIIPIDLTIELDAAPGMPMPGVLSETAAIADPTTQTFEVRFVFTPPEDLLVLPGMTGIVSGRFRLANTVADEQIQAPLSAILGEAGATYVWLVETDTMTVSRRDVTVKPGAGQMVVIETGLTGGDVIVGAGGHYLTEGAKIRAFNEQVAQ